MMRESVGRSRRLEDVAKNTASNGRHTRTGAARHRLIAALIWTGAIATSYLFMLALARGDRAGRQTLSSCADVVTALRETGRLVTAVAGRLLLAPPLALFGMVAALTLILLRRLRPTKWTRDAAVALLLPSLAAGARLLLVGRPAPAALVGLLAGCCLLALGSENRGEEAQTRDARPVLLILPLALGTILRFHALAQVPKGYAEHAVVHHAELSLPYFELLSSALATHHPQPFLSLAADALVLERFGFTSLVAAAGFELFGVTLTVTRLVSALFGVLTIGVAYRLGRALSSVRLGLVYAFLLAVSPWHVTVSRYGDQEHVFSPLQLLLSLLFVVLASTRGCVLYVVCAAVFTGLAWYVYPANLVVPAIAAGYLLCRAAEAPRDAARNWCKAVFGIALFLLVSWAPVKEMLRHGALHANTRTGYQASGSVFSDLTKRSAMLVVEAGQLVKEAGDPWFAMHGGGLGLLQSTLFVPGLVLAAGALLTHKYRGLALVLLIGLPVGMLPAIFAPDPSFRRLMLVTTLAALVSSFALLRLTDLARAAWSGRRVAAGLTCAGAAILAAAGTFGYFDRVRVETETGCIPPRALAEEVAAQLGNGFVLAVVPLRDHVTDTHRYLKLTAYDTLADAKKRGLKEHDLYAVTTCEDPVENPAATGPNGFPPRVLVVRSDVLEERPPCGRGFFSQLRAHYPGSEIVVSGYGPALRDSLAKRTEGNHVPTSPRGHQR